jgi:FlaA1/EpsC-like NDP-sugar epimerase
MTKLFIIGASGHARVSLDILEAQGLEVAGFFDDDPDLIGEKLYGIPVLGDLSDFQVKLENKDDRLLYCYRE